MTESSNVEESVVVNGVASNRTTKKTNSEDSSSARDEYLKKLDKCLLLILNDEPDHRDDTIISKLLDSLQSQIDEEAKRNESDLLNRLVEFVSVNILESDLDAKEHDIAKFALDLIALTLRRPSKTTTTITTTNGDYLRRILVTLDTLTSLHVDNMSEMNPPVLVSLIQLMSRLLNDDDDSLISSSGGDSLLAQFMSQLNARLLNASAHFLDSDSSAPKSIYLRREFKKFYLERLRKEPEATRLDEISPANLDIVCEVIKHGLTSIKEPALIMDDVSIDSRVMSRLKKLGDEFAAKQMDLLINWKSSLQNDCQIEAFAHMSAYAVFLGFMSPCDADQFPNQKEALLNEKFIKILNKICNHLSSTTSNEVTAGSRDSLRELRQRLNLMFKLMLSFFSFLDETNNDDQLTCPHVHLESSYLPSCLSRKLLGFDARPTREALKHTLVQYLVSPLYIRLNNNNNSTTSSPTTTSSNFDNYLLILNDLQSFESRKLVLSTSLIHLRQFVRKFASFAANILVFTDASQLVYLLKHTGLDASIKSDVLQLCSDIFSASGYLNNNNNNNTSQSDYATVLMRHVESNLALDERDLATASFRFIETVLGQQSTSVVSLETTPLVSRLLSCVLRSNEPNLAELNCLQLGSMLGERPAREAAVPHRSLLPRLSQLVEFMSDLLGKSNPNALKFELVSRILRADDFRVLKVLLNFLVADVSHDPSLVVDEPLNDLRQAAYILLNGYFRFASTRNSNLGSPSDTTSGLWYCELTPLTSSESTIGMIEKKSCDETEAFVRREAIAFLSSYHLHKLKRCGVNSSHARSLYTSLNFFSHTLDIDLDWEVHLHCLKHIAQVIRLVTSDLDKYSTRPRQKSSSSSTDQISQEQQQENLDDQQKDEAYYENLNNSNGCADVSSKFSRQLETANSIDVVFVYSECLPTLLKVVSPNSCYDRVVVATAAELLLDLKHNEPLMGVIASNSSSSSSSSSLDSISIEMLEEILAENRLSSDLYTRHPVFILDDVISSYQFDLDEEKAADCY